MSGADEFDGGLGGSIGRRELSRGAAMWMAFCVVAVLVRGAQWDEQYEMAQVVLRQIPYPTDHPLFRCTRSALNLQIYFTSALLWLTHSPALVCGFRNALYLMADTVPVFLMGATLARKAVYGHAASVLVLIGLPEEFHGSYPLHVWPPFSSTGPVGTGFALLTVYFVVTSAWRPGLPLLGFMPGIHIAQMPAPLGLACLRCVSAFGTPEWRNVRRGAAGLAAGLAVCALMWVGKGLVSVPAPVAGPYFSDAPAGPIWSTFIKNWDEHRALPGGMIQYTNSFFAMGAALFLFGACARIERQRLGRRATWYWLYVYVILCAFAVWGIMLIHECLRERIPYVLIAWMPYRFSNHVVILLVAALPAMLVWGADARGRRVGVLAVAVALAYGVLRPVLSAALPAVVYSRYAATGEGVLYALCGVAAALLYHGLQGAAGFRRIWLASQIILLCVLAGFHHFGSAMAALGLLGGLGLHSVFGGGGEAAPGIARPRAIGAAIGAGCVVVLAVLLYPQWRGRTPLPLTDLDRRITAYLVDRGEPDAMLVSNPVQYSLQSRLGHPILIDGPLELWIPYMPSLGPTIQKIKADIYGGRYVGSSGDSHLPWTDLWSGRSVVEWQGLAGQYSIRYVLAPAGLKLRLPEAVRGDEGTLYEIPAGK